MSQPKQLRVGSLTVEQFFAVSLLNIYLYADVAWPGVRKAKDRRRLWCKLSSAGLLGEADPNDEGECSGAIYQLYCQALEEHVAATFGDEWKPTHDYWGAKCFHNDLGWDAPATGTLFAGDSSNHYMTFASAKALWDETHRKQEELLLETAHDQ